MPEQAKVTSIEALESFRTSLIVYQVKAKRCLDEICDEVVRTRLWLQTDRRFFWENEVRRRTKELEQRQQELFSVRLSVLQASAVAQQMALQKAKRALQEAETRLALVRQWSRQYDSRVEPLAKEANKLREFLMQDLRTAIARLAGTGRTLDAYAGVAPRRATNAANPPGPEPDATAANEESKEP